MWKHFRPPGTLLGSKKMLKRYEKGTCSLQSWWHVRRFTFFKISTAWSSEVYKWVCSHYFSFMIYIMLCSHMSEYSIGSTFSKSKRHHNHLFTNDKLLTETMPKWFHFRCWSLRLWSFPLECGFLGRIASLWPSEDRFENAGRSKAWDGRWSENRRRSAGSAD
jgi:hypothetical protein